VFGIGAVARLGGVSVRTLRYYDEIGLLRPVWTDPNTGYRWYEPDQLHRLHRIVALRDLGVRLVEIGRLLDNDVSVDELRGILLLRRAEAHDRLASEAARLARVEARLDQLKEEPMTEYDVVLKTTDPQWVIGISESLAGLDDIGPAHARLWPRVHAVTAAWRRPPRASDRRSSRSIRTATTGSRSPCWRATRSPTIRRGGTCWRSPERRADQAPRVSAATSP